MPSWKVFEGYRAWSVLTTVKLNEVKVSVGANAHLDY